MKYTSPILKNADTLCTSLQRRIKALLVKNKYDMKQFTSFGVPLGGLDFSNVQNDAFTGGIV